MGILGTIFSKIARKFGYTLEQKQETGSDYYAPSTSSIISVTQIVSERLSRITTMDSTVRVYGDSQRALYLSDFSHKSLMDRWCEAVEISLGTGDVLIKPYTDGVRIGIDIIPNTDFVVCESCGNFLKAVIIKCEEMRKDNGYKYERYELQRLQTVTKADGTTTTAVHINQFAFRNGSEVPLSVVEAWSGIEPETIVEGCDRLLLGRIKCPTVNKRNINGVQGVPITNGMEALLTATEKSVERYNDEFDRKEAYVFADKTLFRRDENGEAVIPSGKKRLFMLLPRAKDTGENLIHEYSPDIRHESLEAGVEMNFKMVELMCGLSAGVLSTTVTNAATATEIKAVVAYTWAYVTQFRQRIDCALQDVLYAVDVLCNVNRITEPGDYALSVDWSSAYVEDLNAQFDRLIRLAEKGWVSGEEVRAWTLDEDITQATERIAQLAAVGSSKGQAEKKENEDVEQVEQNTS